jgi:hypothetical protein
MRGLGDGISHHRPGPRRGGELDRDRALALFDALKDDQRPPESALGP